MYLFKTPKIVQNLIPSITWKGNDHKKVVYLTFDDGPIPEVTPWVLDVLNKYNAKATFFCVGENIDKNPKIFQRILDEGHSVGNHTYNHLDGWITDKSTYLKNVQKCNRKVNSSLFRPPYGRIGRRQFNSINKHFEIILWDVLSGDFDPKLSADDCYENVITNSEDGSIIVFHDSLKAEDKLSSFLERCLQHFQQSNYEMQALANSGKSLELEYKNVG